MSVRETLKVGDRAPEPPDAGDAGYAKTLQPRHIGMIAIGGAIGTGLFLGVGVSLQKAGPGLALSYAVAGIFAFLVVGVWLLIAGQPVDGEAPGWHVIADNGGVFPKGIVACISILQSVIFAYAAVELVGITAGETAEPRRIVPKAVNSVMWRIAVFYVGSVLLLTLLLPWTDYSGGQSPFVTVFSKLGMPAAGGIMNMVVLTAALSSLNSGLYSTGRILRSMAAAGSAPRFTGVMSRHHVPYGGILLTAGAALLGVGLNAWLPGQAFEIVTNIAALGIICTWSTIMICHLEFVRRARRGELERPEFRLFFSPVTELATLLFLLFVIVEMGVNGGPVGRWTVVLILPITAGLVCGWKARRQTQAED